MFEGLNIGIDLDDDWLPTLAVAWDAVDKLLGEGKADFHFSQITKKYGSARIYSTFKIADKDVE